MAFEAAQITFDSSSVANCAHCEADDEFHRGIERQMSDRDDTSGVLAERWTKHRDKQFRRRIEDLRLLVESGRASDISIEAQQSAKTLECVRRNADLRNAIQRRGCRRTASVVLADFAVDSAASDKAPLLPRELSRHDAEAASYDDGPIVSDRRGRMWPREPERPQSAVDFEARVQHEGRIQAVHFCADLNSTRFSRQAKSPND